MKQNQKPSQKGTKRTPPKRSNEKQTAADASGAGEPIRIPVEPADQRRALHTWVTGGGVYAAALSCGVTGAVEGNAGIENSAHEYNRDVLQQMKCKDPLEEMLVTQALWSHARAAHLTMLANQQTEVTQIRVIHEYADRASNTFRRLMLALADYRCPRRAGDGFVAIKANHANIGNQQIIAPVVASEKQIATNEKGLHDVIESSQSQTCLLPVEGRTNVPSGERPSREALDVHCRSPDPGGKGEVEDERVETRRAIGDCSSGQETAERGDSGHQ